MRTIDSFECSQVSGCGLRSKLRGLSQSARYDKVGTLDGGYNLYKDTIGGSYWAGISNRPRLCGIPGDKILQVKLAHSVEGICPSLA
jgi:hypothetical protein